MASDKETQRQLRRARRFADLVSHPHWNDAKDELVAQLLELSSIAGLDDTKDGDELRFQIKVRKEITRIMYNWIGSIETSGKVAIDNTVKVEKAVEKVKDTGIFTVFSEHELNSSTPQAGV